MQERKLLDAVQWLRPLERSQRILQPSTSIFRVSGDEHASAWRTGFRGNDDRQSDDLRGPDGWHFSQNTVAPLIVASAWTGFDRANSPGRLRGEPSSMSARRQSGGSCGPAGPENALAARVPQQIQLADALRILRSPSSFSRICSLINRDLSTHGFAVARLPLPFVRRFELPAAGASQSRWRDAL